MAKLLDVKRCWFHARPYPHYDMPKSWVAPMDFGLTLDEHLFNVDVHNAATGEDITYEEVSQRELFKIVKGQA
jgi:hypothetical protein